MTGRGSPLIELAIPTGPEAAGSARAALEPLGEHLEAQVLDDLRLMVSELVTNSVRHAGLGPGARILVRVEFTPSCIRVEVIDPGPGFEHRPVRPTPVQPSGWGLFLVGHIAARWGIEREDTTRVWFELDEAVHPGEGDAAEPNGQRL